MKNLNKYALINAMMLAGAIGFTACSSDNDPIEEQRNGNEEVVKTQFAINIPYAGKGNTRMSDKIVQGQNPAEFRGMQNIRLMPVMLTGDNITGVPADDNSTKVNGSTIILGNIENLTGTYKIYNNVSIPLETNAFLFYGEALITDTEPEVNGKLIPSPDFSNKIDDNLPLSTISFDLQPIAGTEKESDIEAAQKTLAEILTTIANAPVPESEESTVEENKKWANTQNEQLKTMYNQFISLKAGSANSIRLTVQDLCNKLNELDLTKDTEDYNLRTNIKKEIAKYFKEKKETTAEEGEEGETVSPITLEYINDNTYPTDKGLPCGSVRVQWANNKFTYVNPSNESTDKNDNPFTIAGLSSYTYPSALFYMSNTTIKTADSEMSSSYTDDKDNPKAWNDILNAYTNPSPAAITSSTRSVALVNPINYAVGRFDVKAKFANETVKDKQNKDVAIGNGFPLTGVLIGGQKKVNWNFLPTGTEEYTIYDQTITDKTMVGTDNTNVLNKTLVLASTTVTEIKADSKDGAVHFALELTNNSGEAFEGIDGIIHNGATFYLVGELTPGTSNGETHLSVFEKDHYTTATVTISSLQKAYNCVPDLRTPKLELGLSVDLKWEEGLLQEVEIK